MRRSPVLFGGIAFVMLMQCTGCTHMHRVVNTGDSTLYAVTVHSGNAKFGHGYLPPRASKTYAGAMKIEREPVVSWKTSESGQPMSQEVKLDSNPGNCEVVFELDGKTVKALLRAR
jgi:hypothetical protein